MLFPITKWVGCWWVLGLSERNNFYTVIVEGHSKNVLLKNCFTILSKEAILGKAAFTKWQQNIKITFSVIFWKYSFMHFFFFCRDTFILLLFCFLYKRSFSKEEFFQQRFRNRLTVYISCLNILLIKDAWLPLEVLFFKGACFSTIQKMFPKGESSSYWSCLWKQTGFTQEYRHLKNVKIVL